MSQVIQTLRVRLLTAYGIPATEPLASAPVVQVFSPPPPAPAVQAVAEPAPVAQAIEPCPVPQQFRLLNHLQSQPPEHGLRKLQLPGPALLVSHLQNQLPGPGLRKPAVRVIGLRLAVGLPCSPSLPFLAVAGGAFFSPKGVKTGKTLNLLVFFRTLG